MPTRCCIPPERWAGYICSNPLQADHVEVPRYARPSRRTCRGGRTGGCHHGPPGEQPRVLEDVAEPCRPAAVGRDRRRAGRRRLDARHDVEERALPTTRRADHRDERLAAHLEVEPVQRPHGRLVLRRRRELLHDLRRLQDRHVGSSRSSPITIALLRPEVPDRPAPGVDRPVDPLDDPSVDDDHHDEHDDAPGHQPVVVRRRLIPVAGAEPGTLVAPEPLDENDAAPRRDDRQPDPGDQCACHRRQRQITGPRRARDVVGIRHVPEVAGDREGPLQDVDDQPGVADTTAQKTGALIPNPNHMTPNSAHI